jgi:hypothetical protein
VQQIVAQPQVVLGEQRGHRQLPPGDRGPVLLPVADVADDPLRRAGQQHAGLLEELADRGADHRAGLGVGHTEALRPVVADGLGLIRGVHATAREGVDAAEGHRGEPSQHVHLKPWAVPEKDHRGGGTGRRRWAGELSGPLNHRGGQRISHPPILPPRLRVSIRWRS